MEKIRVYEVAKQLNLDPKAVVQLFRSIGVTDVRNHMSYVDVDAIEALRTQLRRKLRPSEIEEIEAAARAREAAAREKQRVLAEQIQREQLAEIAREAKRRHRREERKSAYLSAVDQESARHRAIEADIRGTHWGINEDDDRPLADALLAKIEAARDLAEQYFHARIDFRHSLESMRGDVFADGHDRMRGLDESFAALKRGWESKWNGITLPPRCNDERLLAHMREATAWYRARVPLVPLESPKESDPLKGNPAWVGPELTRGIRRVHGRHVYGDGNRRVRVGRREPVGIVDVEGTHTPPAPKERVRTSTPATHPDRPRVAKPPPTPAPTPMQKRRARLDEQEQRLLTAIREHPGLALGALEKIIRAKNGTMAGALDRLLACGDVENRASDKRPKYFAIS